MNKQQLKEQSLLYLLSQNNFIVPEIQREYVWGQNNEVISRFLDSIIEKIGAICDQCGNPNINSKINVGFLYTYKPSHVIYSHERFLDENLIDGQQRFTTLFLLLFYCAIKEDRLSDFKDVVRLENEIEMAFDYKVRDLTHIFLMQLVDKVSSLDDLELIIEDKSTWLLDDFKADVTVLSIIEALKIIHQKLSSTNQYIFNYVLNNIKFYHFRTEATNQGEELYITMNSRGEALSKNEENKAILMFDDDSLFDFGPKWEEWQDFFWKNRDRENPGSNADIGFNEFIRWIQIIEMSVSDTDTDTNEDEKIDDKSLTKEIITLIQGEKIILNKQYFSIEKIENYYKSVEYLFNEYFNNVNNISEEYRNYNQQIFKKRFLHPKNKIIEQSEIFQLVPLIYYVLKLKQKDKLISELNVFRLSRFLFNLRKDTTVRKTINKQTLNAIKLIDVLIENNLDDIAQIINIQDRRISRTLLTSEEEFKFKIYLANSENREKIEFLFWNAENNKILNGKIASILQFSYCEDYKIKDFEFQKSFDSFNAEKFDFLKFNKLFNNFLKIIEENNDSLSNNIWASMLLTDYYQIREYDEKHKIVSCKSSEDFFLLRDKYFLENLIKIDSIDSAEIYFQNIFNDFISKYDSLDELANENDYKKQLFAYSMALINQKKWEYWKGKNFGVYLNPDSSFRSFFKNNVRYQHFKQKWVGAHYNYFDDSEIVIKKFFSDILN